jgi:ribose 1,5-bisphosphokinase PhnN
MTPKVIVISGTMGAGKTTVLGEASDVLAERHVLHAAIDLDGVTAVGLPDDHTRDLTGQNLSAVFANLMNRGIRHVMVAAAVESREDLQDLRRALSEPEIVICRLVANRATLEQRIRGREPGMSQELFVARSRHLDAILDEAAIEDFVERNDDGRRITDVAIAMLSRAGWIP